jgi:hypothetical protein
MMAGAIGAAVALGVVLGLGLKASMRAAPVVAVAPTVVEAPPAEPARDPAANVPPDEGGLGAAAALPEHRPGVPVGAVPVVPPPEERVKAAGSGATAPRQVEGTAARAPEISGPWKAVDPQGVSFTLELSVDADGKVTGRAIWPGAPEASVAGTAAASEQGWTLALTITGTDGPLMYAGKVDADGAVGTVMRGGTDLGKWSARR